MTDQTAPDLDVIRAIVRSARAELADFERALRELGIELEPIGFANSRLLGLGTDLSWLAAELGIRDD